MRALKFIRGPVTFKLHYNQIYQLKTTIVAIVFLFSIKREIKNDEAERLQTSFET